MLSYSFFSPIKKYIYKNYIVDDCLHFDITEKTQEKNNHYKKAMPIEPIAMAMYNRQYGCELFHIPQHIYTRSEYMCVGDQLGKQTHIRKDEQQHKHEAKKTLTT
jgi:hypothetical protein